MASVMSPVPSALAPDPVIYPESDGKPMAENTLQWNWIFTIKSGLEVLFASRPDVFVASDLLWYPVQGNPRIRTAPDAMMVFGRPKGDRGSYLQWKEDGLPFQAVFEVLSPGNDMPEMTRKFDFYRRFGVLEYYIYNPGDFTRELRITALNGWQRTDAAENFQEIENMDGWRSPLLGITFQHNPLDGLKLLHPDGKPFETYQELSLRAEQNAQLAEQNARLAEQNARRLEQMAARLRAAGLDPDAE